MISKSSQCRGQEPRSPDSELQDSEVSTTIVDAPHPQEERKDSGAAAWGHPTTGWLEEGGSVPLSAFYPGTPE